jgi:endonuclease YncB( thermonuclease family)
MSQQPPIAWTMPCRVVGIHDGDTVTVEVTRRFEVRLLDCWCPEVHKKDQREAGLAAKAHMESLLADNPECAVSIPLVERRDGYYDPGDATTMGRVLGHIWRMGDRVSLSERMVAAGHATATKGIK